MLYIVKVHTVINTEMPHEYFIWTKKHKNKYQLMRAKYQHNNLLYKTTKKALHFYYILSDCIFTTNNKPKNYGTFFHKMIFAPVWYQWWQFHPHFCMKKCFVCSCTFSFLYEIKELHLIHYALFNNFPFMSGFDHWSIVQNRLVFWKLQ
jgi:hypothetical protein